MLLEKIDKLHVHRYNFFYLPIDLKNNCNFGYAFINLETQFYLPFYEDLNVKSWESFNSEKICEITYGRIQSKRSLVDNFSYSAETRKVKPLILEFPSTSKLTLKTSENHFASMSTSMELHTEYPRLCSLVAESRMTEINKTFQFP